MAGVTYIAQKRLLVGGEYRMPGEEVPEAINWMNVDAYINRGMLAVVPSKDSRDVEPRMQRGLREAGATPPGDGQRARQRLVPLRFVESEQDEREEEEAAELSDEYTLEELYERAQELDIEGRSDMNKDELAEAIAKVEAETTEPSETEETEEEEGDETEEALDYHSMTVEEVQDAYSEGLLTIEEIDEREDEREKGRRKTLDEWLDSLEEDEDEGESEEE